MALGYDWQIGGQQPSFGHGFGLRLAPRKTTEQARRHLQAYEQQKQKGSTQKNRGTTVEIGIVHIPRAKLEVLRT